jgi:DNA polymerase III alpha subunit (gram-positive type)
MRNKLRIKTFAFDDEDMETLERITYDGAALFDQNDQNKDGISYFDYLKTLTPQERYEELKSCGSFKEPTLKKVRSYFWGTQDLENKILLTYGKYFFIDEEDVISKNFVFQNSDEIEAQLIAEAKDQNISSKSLGEIFLFVTNFYQINHDVEITHLQAQFLAKKIKDVAND